jgi:hypothetical protein
MSIPLEFSKAFEKNTAVPSKLTWTVWQQALRLLVLCGLGGLLLLSVPAQATPYNEALCPAAQPEPGLASDKSVMCFEQCKPDHMGVGTACVQAICPTGTTDIGLACVGAPSLPTCGVNQQNVLGVCYGSCPANYKTVALTCVQATPAGWNDGGAFFYRWVTKRVCVWRSCWNTRVLEKLDKNVTLRPAGGVASTCPAGQTYTRGICQRSEVKSTYLRSGVTSRFQGGTESFVREIQSVAAETFTVAVVSDTQLPWDETSSAARQGKATVETLWKNSRLYNLQMVQAINALQATQRNTKSPLAFTVMNGDLTAFFHPDQLSEFRAFYDESFAWAYPNVLKTPVYLGLGNHDYQNNVNDCSASSLDKNRCAKNAVNLIRGSVFAGYTRNMPASNIESYDAGSLAYSWNQGPYHFVQLHNGPSYEAPALSISKSLSWLKTDLARAQARGQSVVINSHIPDQLTSAEFLSAIDGMPVAAMFAGHLHTVVGLQNTVVTPAGRKIPVFLSGSADKRTFLKVDFASTSIDPRQLTVTVMSTQGGQAQAVGQPVVVLAAP